MNHLEFLCGSGPKEMNKDLEKEKRFIREERALKDFQQNSLLIRPMAKPSWFNAHALYRSSSLENGHPETCTLYLDIDLRDKILTADFEMEGLSTYCLSMTVLCQILPGKKIEEAYSLGMDDIFLFIEREAGLRVPLHRNEFPLIPLPLLLLQKSLEEFQGIPPTHAKLWQQKEEDLLCRCFGIYGEQVRTFLKNNPFAELKDVTLNLRAGGGCAQCTRDIQKIVMDKKYRPSSLLTLRTAKGYPQSEPYKVEHQPRRVGKTTLTPVQFALQAQPIIDRWVLENHPHLSHLKIDLMKIEDATLFLRVKTGGEKQGYPDHLQNLENWEELRDFLRGLFGSDLLLTNFN